MKDILLVVTFLIISTPLFSQSEPSLESLLLKIDLPITSSEEIKSSKLEAEEFYVFRFYFSATAMEQSELYGNNVKYQILYGSYMMSLCETLRNCDNMTFKFAEDVKRNDFLKQERRYYEESKIDYDIVLYFDQEVDLKSVEKVIRTFDNTKKIGNIYLAYTNTDQSKPILLYNFNRKSNYAFITSNNEKYSDWVKNNFKVQYGEVITIVED